MKHVKFISRCLLIPFLLIATKNYAQDGQCVISTVNYDFEEPVIPQSGVPSFEDHDDVPGWQTTASDEVIEFWPNATGGGGIIAYSGDQYIELNANETSGVYQDYQTPMPGIEFTYSFAHAARNFSSSGEDVVGVYAGPPGGTLTLLAQYSSEVNTGWSLKTGTYTVPAGQPETRFEFRAISTATGDPTVGNFLDAIQFTANFGILSQNPMTISCTNTIEVEALGEGQWVADDVNNPSVTVIADPNSGDTTISGLDVIGTYVFAWTNPACYDILTVEVVEGIIPVNTIMASLPEKCDINMDGSEDYDLTQSVSIFIDNPQDYQIQYYETQSGANSADNDQIITSPENYAVQAGATKTVFLRIGSGTCYQVVALQLETYVVPQARDIVDLNSCDNSAGFFNIDLAQNNANIIGNQNPANIDISYYLTLDDAQNDLNEITDPSNFHIQDLGCETIYARVENSNQEQCYQVVDFQACAIEISISSPEDLESCTLSGDGLADFDLTQNDIHVIGNGNPSSFHVKYYTTLLDAESDTNAIGSSSGYHAESQTQTIYVRLENAQNVNCYSIESFDIVSHQVAIFTLEDIEVCSEGISGGIDLTESEKLLDLAPDQKIMGYYNTLQDASSNENAIDAPATYTGFFGNETVYIRTEEQTTPCYTIYTVSFIEGACELYIPQGFSPNNDGVNDVFEITGLYERYPKFNIKIFSRYGNIVYEGGGTEKYWNGTSQGNELPTSTYFYVLNLNSSGSKIIKGWVYLNR